MADPTDLIETFLAEMRRRYREEIDAVTLPDGTLDYVRRRVEAGDVDTIVFMLKLGYLMGLQTGFAAGQAGDAEPPRGPGPMQA
ncbi:hypothetical protein BH23DEI1_BH23DEI1_08280 [soil metagenome]|nr:DdrH [Trueperaceae bacterium]